MTALVFYCPALTDLQNEVCLRGNYQILSQIYKFSGYAPLQIAHSVASVDTHAFDFERPFTQMMTSKETREMNCQSPNLLKPVN